MSKADNSIDEWWLRRLQAGAQTSGAARWEPFVPSQELLDDCLCALGMASANRRSVTTEFGIRMRVIAPSILRVRRTIGLSDARRVWGFAFPELIVCRRDFEKATARRHTWLDVCEERPNHSG